MEMDSKYSYCNVEGNTDVGCKRKANEDWLDTFECETGLVAVVCDGMGGHVGGQIASHVAVEAIRNFLTEKKFDDPKAAIIAACDAANKAILKRAAIQPELTGMGSTCVMLIVSNGQVYIGSVGDSRIYLVRDKKIKQLTKDQSYVQMLVDAGQITQEQAEHHPRKNEITNALGLQNMKPATVLETPFNPEAGDCFLLCSDGLSGMVPDKEIEKIVGNISEVSQRDRVNALIQKAKLYGGLDNITCQIVEFAATPGELNNKKNAFLKYGIPVLATALLGVVGFLAWNYIKPKHNVENEQITERIEESPNYFVDSIYFRQGEKPTLKIKEDNINKRLIFIFKDNALNQREVPLEGLKLDSMKINDDNKYWGRNYDYNDNITTLSFDGTDIPEFLNLIFANEGVDRICRLKLKKFEEQSRENTDDGTPRKNGSVSRVYATKFKDKNKENTTEKDIPKPLEITLLVPNETKKYSLVSADSINTGTTFYTDEVINPGNKKSEWYEYNCSDRRTCNITIKGKNVPNEGGNIIIALGEGKTYTIHVRKRKK